MPLHFPLQVKIQFSSSAVFNIGKAIQKDQALTAWKSSSSDLVKNYLKLISKSELLISEFLYTE